MQHATSVDEGAAQTAAIHKSQRHSRTLEGLLGRKHKSTILTLHQNAQRLLRSLAVVNPFAEELTFSSHKTRMRRDHMKYLSLIDSIALLHQHQREIKTVVHEGAAIEYIEVTKGDINVANRLAQTLLGRSLDELPPQTRRLLGLVKELVAEICQREAIEMSLVRFRRRQLRDAIGWGNTQLKVHLARLVEMEYLVVHRAPSGNAFFYELCCQASEEMSVGLLETCAHDGRRSGQGSGRSAPGRPSVGPW